jgi:hypothetical protein
MNNPQLLKVLIGTLAAALCVSIGITVWALWNAATWKVQVQSLAQLEGAFIAKQDFQAGRLRLFIISGRREVDEYSGTNEGPFEVWYSSYFPEIPAYRCAAETRVAVYDAKMRYWHQHPDRFPTNWPNKWVEPTADDAVSSASRAEPQTGGGSP